MADAALDRTPGLAAPRPATEVEAALAAFAVATVLERAGLGATVALGGAIPSGPVVQIAIARPVAATIAVAVADVVAPPPRPLAALVAARGARLPAVIGRVEVAPTTIAAARLAGLRVGDVVVPGGGAARLAVARGWFAATLDRGAGRLTVAGPYARAPMTAPADLLAADLRVSLSIVVGEVELSARALLELAPGQVLTTAIAVGGPVELVAAGRTVARGELVVVDGDLGVRVIDVLSPPPATC